MSKKLGLADQNACPMQDEATPFYRSVELHSVKEDFLTQIGPGSESFRTNRLVADDVMLIGQCNPPLSVGGTVMMPHHFAIVVPLSWKGEYVINGGFVEPNSVFVTSRPSGFVSRGQGRILLGVSLPREPVLHTLAALRGVAPDEIALPDGMLDLPPLAIFRLRASLREIMSKASTGRDDPTYLAAVRERTIGEVLDACLLADSLAIPPPSAIPNLQRIVRRAEERFAEAEWGRISLADLCVASGVSQSALYIAFQRLYGEPPLRYFHRRRLNLAREILATANPQRGMVQRTALEVGLTEFGRFSRDYRELFGEPPSATLTAPRLTSVST